VDVAVEALALGLEALEHPLGDLDRLVTALRVRRHPASAQEGRTGLDVADRKLELLQPAEGEPARLVWLTADAGLQLRVPLVGPLETLDLYA